jgi:hypothetical protein
MHSCIPHTTFSKAGATTLRKGSKWVAKLVEAVSLAVQELQKGNERREEKRRGYDANVGYPRCCILCVLVSDYARGARDTNCLGAAWLLVETG